MTEVRSATVSSCCCCMRCSYSLDVSASTYNNALIMYYSHYISSLYVVFAPDTRGLVAEVSIAANDGIRGVIEWTNTM